MRSDVKFVSNEVMSALRFHSLIHYLNRLKGNECISLIIWKWFEFQIIPLAFVGVNGIIVFETAFSFSNSKGLRRFYFRLLSTNKFIVDRHILQPNFTYIWFDCCYKKSLDTHKNTIKTAWNSLRQFLCTCVYSMAHFSIRKRFNQFRVFIIQFNVHWMMW